MANRLKVTIENGEDRGKEFDLELFTSLLVGRSRSSAIRIHDADVSGKHFEFVRSSSGCCVKDLSRNGLKVDGRVAGEGEIVPVKAGALIEIGSETRLRVVEIPEVVEAGEPSAESGTSSGVDESLTSADFFTADVRPTDIAPSVATSDKPAAADTAPVQETGGGTTGGEAGDTRGDFEDALTEAGEGETQEMKTRVGSMEEIVFRKRQLDRASMRRRWKFASIIVSVLVALVGVWFYTGTGGHVSDAEGPFLPNGDPDLAYWDVTGETGELEMYLEYPRDDNMRIEVSADSNAVSVASFLGIDRDVPFYMDFKRWRDPDDLQYSLEDSFERRLRADAEGGMTFEASGLKRPQGEYFDTVFPGYCELVTQRGVRFVRTEYTRPVKNDLRHGVVLYLRNGDVIYRLRTELPDIYWKRGGYRLTGEPHLALYKAFSKAHWDSPGRAGLVSGRFSDDYLLQQVKRELAADRVSSWPAVERYLDTILVRSWSVKPVVRKMAMGYLAVFNDRLNHFYNERRFAFETAKSNRDEKRIRNVFTDVKTVFGAMPQDRRYMLVNDPEEWTCQ